MAGIHISAVICTHERYELCRKAIESLLRQTNAGGSYETIVVDNSSSAAEANRFAASFAGRPVKFFHTTSVGLSNARNIGARAAAGDVVAYLDDDAEASPDWVSAIAAAFAAYPGRAGVVGGPVKPIWIEPRPAWMDERFLEIFAIIDRGPRMRPLDAGEWLAGCNIAFARDALLEVGGFDVGLGRIGGSLLSNEETAVCDRIRKLGREVIYAPDVVVGHVVPPERATVDYVRRRVAWQAASDALAYPERSRDLANTNRENWGRLGGLFKAVRLSRVMGTKRASMTRADYDLVYDLVNQLLSRESGRH